MTTSAEGRRLHELAEQARESGDFQKALEYTDQAMLAYQKDGDLLGLSEVLSSRQNTFKHLFQATNDESFLILEKHAAQASVEIAEKSGVKEALGIPYFNLGKYYMEARNYQQAISPLQKAIEYLNTYPSQHSRPTVIADIQGHLYTAQ